MRLLFLPPTPGTPPSVVHEQWNPTGAGGSSLDGEALAGGKPKIEVGA